MFKLKSKNPTLQKIEGEITSLSDNAVTVRYKLPRRQAYSVSTISPYAAVIGDEGDVGTIYYNNYQELEIAGDVGDINANTVEGTVGDLPILINSREVGLEHFIEKADEPPKKSKGRGRPAKVRTKSKKRT